MTCSRLLRGMFAALLVAASPLAVAQTVFSYASVDGDWIGAGRQGVYTPRNAEIWVNGNAGSFTVMVDAGSEWWNINLAAPRGQHFRPGRYYDAERASFRSGRAAGIDVGGNGRGCNDVWGSVFIRQIEQDQEGRITSLEASFLQSCEQPDAPVFAGVVAYKATPLSFSVADPHGGWLGAVGEKDYFGDTSTFALSGTIDGLTYAASGQRDDWLIAITPPVGKTLREGWYWTASEPDTMRAGFDILGTYDSFPGGRRCLKGSLEIVKLVVDPDGDVQRLWARFSQRCDGGPLLTGTIHFRR